MAFREELIAKATEYFDSIEDLQGEVPSLLLIDFVIEKFKQQRNYPKHFTDEMIDKDMTDHISTMAMAVVDLYSKGGAEGETSHSDSGISRHYENAYISKSIFNDIIPFVKVL